MYEKLLKEAEEEALDVVEIKLSKRIKGLYCDGVIAINKDLSYREKACTISEELGHYHKSNGNILDQRCVKNRKQERIARAWGYKRLVTISDLVSAYKEGTRNRYEIAEFLNVTEEFLEESLKFYKEKYGLCYEIDNYVVYFDPLGVLERFF